MGTNLFGVMEMFYDCTVVIAAYSRNRLKITDS